MYRFSFDVLKHAQIEEYEIDKNFSEKSLKNLEQRIDAHFKPRNKGETFNVVYCYLLKERPFSYPGGESNVLYIGSSKGELTKSQKVSLSYRFKHCKKGKDSKSNVCLSFYYERGDRLILKIFDLEHTTDSCTQKEQELRTLFIQTYAAFPIADGASYKKQYGG